MQSTFIDAGWDFIIETTNGTSQVWQMSMTVGYPILSTFNGYSPIVLMGDGSLTSPYLIGDALELGAVYHYNPNAYFQLTADIDLIGIQWSTGVIPVLSGSLNGNGHTISNLNIDGGRDLGFVCYLGSNGMISNLGLENISITSSDLNVGGLVGFTSDSNVINCYSTGLISSTGANIGGLIGYNYQSSVSTCHSVISVSGGRYVGGLIGTNHYSVIENCYSTGFVSGIGIIGHDVGGLTGSNQLEASIINSYSTCDVTGNDYVGGLNGTNYGSIESCYSFGAVNGNDYVGGLVGINSNNISNCYATGTATGDKGVGGLVGGITISNFLESINHCYSIGRAYGNSYVGGLAGVTTPETILTNNFWDIGTSGTTIAFVQNSGYPNYIEIPVYSSAGFVEGKTTIEMQTQSTFTSASWDFTNEILNGTNDLWRMCSDGVDYPRLNWESTDGDFTCPNGVNTEDLDYYFGNWLMNNCTIENNYCGGADLNYSGVVDLADFSIFAENWLLEI
jgi:hypothetical protein